MTPAGTSNKPDTSRINRKKADTHTHTHTAPGIGKMGHVLSSMHIAKKQFFFSRHSYNLRSLRSSLPPRIIHNHEPKVGCILARDTPLQCTVRCLRAHISSPFFAKTFAFSLEIQQNAFFFTNRAAGGQAQVLRDVNCDSKSSEHGVNRAPSRVVPEVDDIPRPVHRPLF